MEVQKKLITPARAVELLQSNVKNRRPKNPVVLKYARDMASGKWKSDTFELIKISKSGVILDGQHRLMAVVKSNTPTFFHVVENLEDSIFDVLDTGSTRNASDVFKINGVSNNNVIPSIISFYYTLKGGNITKSAQVNYKKTNADLLEIYLENKEFWDELTTQTLFLYRSFSKILAPSFIGGFYAFFSDINNDDAKNFMYQLCTGKNVENDAINILRSRFVTEKISVNKVSHSTKCAYLIKVWNAYRKIERLKILKYTPSVDKFPVAI